VLQKLAVTPLTLSDGLQGLSSYSTEVWSSLLQVVTASGNGFRRGLYILVEDGSIRDC